jgi:hypothetical protein
MNSRFRRRPQVESLESMTLLSGASAAVGGSIAAMTSQVLHLDGMIKGTYHEHLPIPDVGKSYTFTGSGQINPLGRSSLSGSVQTLGFIASGHAHGTLVLSNAHGSVTLQLTGPAQQGFASLPHTFSYTITSASGKFKGDTGSGMVALTLGTSKTATGSIVQTGSFTMVFTPQTTAAS